MRRHLMFGTVFSAALAVAASAQTPAEQAGAAKSDSAQTITVSGCLRSADAKATGTAGSATAAPSASSGANRAGGFILTDVSPSGTEAGAPATPTGTAGAAASSSEKKGYRLSGSSSELSSLVGKRVEVTGSLSNSSAAGATAGAPAAPGAAAGGSMSSSSSQNLPQFRVTSVKEATGGASCPSEK